jgi:hypothetical protein
MTFEQFEFNFGRWRGNWSEAEIIKTDEHVSLMLSVWYYHSFKHSDDVAFMKSEEERLEMFVSSMPEVQLITDETMIEEIRIRYAGAGDKHFKLVREYYVLFLEADNDK